MIWQRFGNGLAMHRKNIAQCLILENHLLKHIQMKYITILEAETTEYQNVGTITTEDIGNRFKEAIESHFDATLISFSFVDEQISSLEDCISASPIDCVVKLDTAGGETDYTVELSETWLF